MYMNAEELIKDMAGTAKAESVFRIATVKSVSGTTAKLKFDGETQQSEKTYSRLASYSPAAGDRVLLARTGATYVILGKIQY